MMSMDANATQFSPAKQAIIIGMDGASMKLVCISDTHSLHHRIPDIPDGWDFIVRSDDDLPPVLTRTNVDGYDPSAEDQESQTQNQSGVSG